MCAYQLSWSSGCIQIGVGSFLTWGCPRIIGKQSHAWGCPKIALLKTSAYMIICNLLATENRVVPLETLRLPSSTTIFLMINLGLRKTFVMPTGSGTWFFSTQSSGSSKGQARVKQGSPPAPARFLHVGRFGKMNPRRSVWEQWSLVAGFLEHHFPRWLGTISWGEKQTQHHQRQSSQSVGMWIFLHARFNVK